MSSNEENIVRASAVLDPTWYPTYLEYRDALGNQLVRLNTTLFNLERIEAFPFDLFTLPDERIFWQSARTALIETALSIEWKILIDNHRDALSLPRFKNDVLRNVQDMNLRNILQAQAEIVDLNGALRQFNVSLEDIRHNYVGHLNQALHLDPTRTPVDLHISLLDMKYLLDKSRELFDILCFESRLSLWLWGYLGNVRDNGQTDIDNLLAFVARSSNLIDMPEKNPLMWEDILTELDDVELQHVNRYRNRFGLPTIDRL